MSFEPFAPRSTGRKATGLTFVPRRRRRRFVRNRRLFGVVAVVLVLGGPVVLSPERFVGADDPSVSARMAQLPPPAEDPVEAAAGHEVSEDALPVAFARHGTLELLLPAREIRLVAFHEAAYPDALQLTPIGRLLANDNTTKFQPPAAGDGPGYVVLSSRGRVNPASSASDIAMDPGVAVLSPVSGTVTAVEPYWLYGRHADTRIEIRPDTAPHLRVVIIHVEGVGLVVGEHVAAGRSVLAEQANHFPFSSHVDRYVDAPPGPHVHLEVKPLEPAEPSDETTSGDATASG